MPRFIGTRENSLDDALNIGSLGKAPGVRRYFNVIDYEGHHDTEVLVRSTENGVLVVLPDYLETEDARVLVEDGTPERIREAALSLVETHATSLF